jgi:hypothetical protein
MEKLSFLIIIAFFAVFPLFFAGIIWLLSVMSGWSRLARDYGSDREFRGAFMHMHSARMGLVNYNSILKAGVYQDCLYLRVIFFFRAGHRHLVIPLAEISGRETKGFLGSEVALSFARVPDMRMRITGRLAEGIERQSGGAWTYARCGK